MHQYLPQEAAILNRILILVLFLLIGSSAGTQENRVVQASDVLAEIRAGQAAEFDYCTIVGDLDLSGLKVEKPVHFNFTTFQDTVNCNFAIFEGDAHFLHSVFDDLADFSHSEFNRTADFRSSEFSSIADFKSSNFNNDVYFGDTAFNDIVDFGHSHFNGNSRFRFTAFNGDADFSDSQFSGTADFSESTFNGDSDFSFSVFNGDAIFRFSIFKGDSNFWSSTFNDIINFRRAIFKGNANFGGTDFNGIANFLSSVFKGNASFGASTFNNEVVFDYASFNSAADFGHSVFNNEVNFLYSIFNNTSIFNTAIFNKGANFNDAIFRGYTSFNGCQFKGDALFESSIFKNRLSLTRIKCGYNTFIYIRLGNINELEYDDAAYLFLLRNFKTLGYFEDYDHCYYQYRTAHRAQGWPSSGNVEEWGRKLLDYPLQYFYGYGTRPFFALFVSAILIIIFGIFWRGLGLGGPHDITSKNLKPEQVWLNDDITSIMIFSATVFLSGMKLFVDPPAIPNIEGRPRSTVKRLFIFERLMGMIFFVMFIIAWSGSVVRQLK
ncbi:MAG TPA: pentapeptide repeat-containing protein [Methanotrichaceae archaeon]|nr:pentapeptide repeat-containing protein [Methanotrichaceae archaeon]HQF15798.1 pentapeptide repeat-containing protein [Methanotrichaceae archaeon]HQI90526.1 pentapeptide repeat-containing protein [Methanotrichaceae archaeon]